MDDLNITTTTPKAMDDVGDRNGSSVMTDILHFVVAILVYSGNIMILIMIPRLKKVKSTSRYLIVHLAVSDLLLAFSITLRSLITILRYRFDEKITCLVLVSFHLTCAGNSVTGSLMLAVDVYVSIKAGFNLMRSTLSKKAIVMLISCSWAFWILTCAASFVITPDDTFKGREYKVKCFIGNELYHVSYMFFVCTIFIFIYFLTAIILILTARLIKHSAREIWKSLPSVTVRYRAMLKLVIFIVTALGICWLPVVIYAFITSMLPSMYALSIMSFLTVPALFQ